MHPYDRYISMYGRLPTERDPKYLELVRMSKYRITDVPDSQPGRCANCGSSQHDSRKYLDIGVELEFYGIVVFCSLCLDEFARKLGLYRALELRVLQLEEIIAKRQSHTDLGEELKKTVLHTFEQVKEYFDANSNNLASSDVFTVTDAESRAAAEEPVSEPSAGTKSGAVKSATVSRSKNVPSLTDLIEARNK
jgi:hypothetical protein